MALAVLVATICNNEGLIVGKYIWKYVNDLKLSSEEEGMYEVQIPRNDNIKYNCLQIYW